MKEHLEHLLKHLYWADNKLFNGLPEGQTPVKYAVSEFSHLLGDEEVWLSRLQHRASRCSVWPELNHTELKDLMEITHQSYKEYIGNLREEDLPAKISYTNSAGKQFCDTISDILLHVALHSQYHRGKINLILRQTGNEPAPVDYIAFVRGVPAATRSTETD